MPALPTSVAIVNLINKFHLQKINSPWCCFLYLHFLFTQLCLLIVPGYIAHFSSFLYNILFMYFIISNAQNFKNQAV